MRDDRGFGRKSLDVLRFLVEKALRNEKRKVCVAMAGLLEHVVERTLHPLPDPVAVRPYHHATAHRRVVGELRAQHNLVIPGAEIVGACRQLLLVCHVSRQTNWWTRTLGTLERGCPASSAST